MDISIIVPIKSLDKSQEFLKSLDGFIKKHSVKEIIFVTADKKIAVDRADVQIVIIDKFSINNAVDVGLKVVTGDVVLIGDPKVDCADVFERMLEKHKSGANVVGVYRQRNWFNNMFFEMGVAITNFFTKMYTDKNDTFCCPSLQLLDRDIVDTINTLPNKSGLIRNSDNIIGVEYAYVPLKEVCSKNEFDHKSVFAISAYCSLPVFMLSILAIILCNVFVKMPIYANIILGVVALIAIVAFVLTITKAVLDMRVSVDKYKVVEKVSYEAPVTKKAKTTTKAKTTKKTVTKTATIDTKKTTKGTTSKKTSSKVNKK